jgi:dTDP-4-amino-4,6-dideoxygalactose transaminase
MDIPFNRPYTTGNEWPLIAEAIAQGHLSGNGPFAKRCAAWLVHRVGCTEALLTPSCTAALEMAAILAGIEPGDEVVMPSFTFVSTANAVVLRGGVPVFVDVRPDTFNLDESQIEAVLTSRTKAIIAVHYAGVGCEMDAIMSLARSRGLLVIEDAAQGVLSTYRGRMLGSIGDLGALSFHETKNVHCGEGGALLLNEARWVDRAEIIHEKGTDRRRFFRGHVDKYTWQDVGSSYVLSDINAAFLCAQLERADEITAMRLTIWDAYHREFGDLEDWGLVRRPIVPNECEHNAHMYYLLCRGRAERDALIREMNTQGVGAVFHYVSLHSSPAGRRFGRAMGPLTVTDDASDRLVRLPLWAGMTEEQVERVVASVRNAVTASTIAS